MSHADMLSAYVDSLLGEPAAAESTPATVKRVAPAAVATAALAAPPARQALPSSLAPTARQPQPVPAPQATVDSAHDSIARLLVPQPAVPDPRRQPATRWLSFVLADQVYAVEVGKVQEVVRVPDIAPVVGAGADTVGVMNLRGQIVQVVSLRERLGLGPLPRSPNCRVVVLEEAGSVLGLLVDAVAEVFGADADAIQDTGLVHGSLPAEWFRGLLRKNNDLVVALDASRLLAH
jgi:purine-binding chemotaxis protein CheW